MDIVAKLGCGQCVGAAGTAKVILSETGNKYSEAHVRLAGTKAGGGGRGAGVESAPEPR